jgi:hypothetical protein
VCRQLQRCDIAPIKGFIHKVLCHSWTSRMVLQTALCSLEAIHPRVPYLVRKGSHLPPLWHWMIVRYPKVSAPIKGFIHEILRHSWNSGMVLQMALCSLEAIRPRVPYLIRKGFHLPPLWHWMIVGYPKVSSASTTTPSLTVQLSLQNHHLLTFYLLLYTSITFHDTFVTSHSY